MLKVTADVLKLLRESAHTFPFSIQKWAKMHTTAEVVDKCTFEVELRQGTGNHILILIFSDQFEVIPKEISFPPLVEWAVEDVCIWLQTLNLTRDYSQKMKDEGVKGRVLITVRNGRTTLQDLGIVPAGDCAIVLESLEYLK